MIILNYIKYIFISGDQLYRINLIYTCHKLTEFLIRLVASSFSVNVDTIQTEAAKVDSCPEREKL